MKTLFPILLMLIFTNPALCQTTYKSFSKEIAKWNFFEKKYDQSKHYKEVTDIILEGDVIIFRRDEIKLTIIRIDKTVPGDEYDLESWIVWGDTPSDILKFTMAKYKTSNDIVFTIIGTKGLIRWYAKQ